MALKGSDIKKMLPEEGKKNCKECGFPTCFSFAMKLAKGEIEVDKCPYVEAEVKAEIEEGLTPPMVLVTIGKGDHAVIIGEEEVMYRHEKSFFHEPGIAVLISDTEDDGKIEKKLEQVRNAVYVRAQVELKPNLWALRFDSGDRGRFEDVVRKVHESSPLSAVLISENLDALFRARDIYKDRNPVIYPITQENLDEALPRIKASPCAVGLKADGVQNLIPLSLRLKAEGLNQLLLDPSSKTFFEGIQDQTVIRRAALKTENRALGYPTIAFPTALSQNPVEEVLYAGCFVAKYAGVVVVSNPAEDYLYPLLVQRMDIYSDPRKLRTVEAKLYEINGPGENSPVLVTTNFALTFFLISSAAEASRVPLFAAILDTGGFGVDTAMADGRFHGQAIADFFKERGLQQKLQTKRMILPHAASRIKNELPDLMPDWEVFVGPKSVNQLSPFLADKAKEWGLEIRG
ncbi:MAG: acetyl-CoA decarbonylase/synthase complex subunit gamma [Deltaproteobacteria bacterium]|nr:acetyl-CoA decarbonylase/synthase complex subunit gamma [Deltaproteobacteria bacterium]